MGLGMEFALVMGTAVALFLMTFGAGPVGDRGSALRRRAYRELTLERFLRRWGCEAIVHGGLPVCSVISRSLMPGRNAGLGPPSRAAREAEDPANKSFHAATG